MAPEGIGGPQGMLRMSCLADKASSGAHSSRYHQIWLDAFCYSPSSTPYPPIILPLPSHLTSAALSGLGGWVLPGFSLQLTLCPTARKITLSAAFNTHFAVQGAAGTPVTSDLSLFTRLLS